MLAPELWPRAATTLARTFGVRGALLRAGHEARRVTGRFTPSPQAFDAAWIEPATEAYCVDDVRLAGSTLRPLAIQRADRVAAGAYEAYRWDWRELPTTPEAWRRNAATGFTYDAGAPWWTIVHLDAAAGDIKDVWEPARFGWVYDLVRGWLVTGDQRYVTAFRAALESWTASGLPFRGVHWSCGQETAIRAIALLYAEANMPRTPGLAAVLAASGERIGDAVGYAVSQRNNHAISEATGLVALGVRFRDQHRDASDWLERGSTLLARLIMEQFAEDGWYIQHSFTYLRVALDQCVVAERALRAVGLALPPNAVARLRTSVELLLAVMDPVSGEVPNHGANDGAYVHPISLAGYRDFRPVVTAACAMWDIAMPSNVACNEEVLAWLGAAPPRSAPPLGDGAWSGASGWAAVRCGSTQVFFRAARYRSRPSHLDALHLDVRMDGREIVVDPGTFAYNAAAPWRNGLVTARVHNGPLLDDVEPGVRGPRFLWYLWPEARMVSVHASEGAVELVAEVPSRVRRTVRVEREQVSVRDVALAEGASLITTWLLHPDGDQETVRSDAPHQWTRASQHSVTAWYSPVYGARFPSASMRVELALPHAEGFTTSFRLAPRTST